MVTARKQRTRTRLMIWKPLCFNTVSLRVIDDRHYFWFHPVAQRCAIHGWTEWHLGDEACIGQSTGIRRFGIGLSQAVIISPT